MKREKVCAFYPLGIGSVEVEFVDEGNGVDLHEPGDVACVSPLPPAVEVADRRIHPKSILADIEVKNVLPFPAHVARCRTLAAAYGLNQHDRRVVGAFP